MARGPSSDPVRHAGTPTRGGGDDDVQFGPTLAEVVDLVLPYLPAGLIAPESASQIRATVAAVPAELVARFGLESPLHSDAGDADVLLSADSETGGMQMLAGRHPLVDLPEGFAAAERWAPAVRFCARREPGCLLHRATRDIWVDLAQPDAPGLSFGMRLGGLPEATRRPLEVLLRALELGLEALRGEALQPPALGSMRALVRRLPETARVDRAGLQTGLPEHVLLWLSRITSQQLGDVVAATRDEGEASALRTVLDELAESVDSIRARVDVHAGIGRGIGLLCAVDPNGSPQHVAARWRPLLDRLVATGLCTDDKRDALLACYGLLREDQSEHWPEHLTKLSKLFGDGTQSVLEWRLHHIAVQCDRGEPVSATAHVVAAHGWSRR